MREKSLHLVLLEVYAILIGSSVSHHRGGIPLLHYPPRFDINHLTQNLNLFRDMSERSKDFLISIHESKLGVSQSLLRSKLLDKFACTTQIVPRESRKEMVRHLEVKTSVDETNRVRAEDIRCGA